MLRKTSQKELDKLRKQLKQFKKQAKEYLAGWKRARADLLNYKKKIEEREKELITFANESLILDILPILDSFERAINVAPELRDEIWLEGVKKIKQNLEKILKEKGLERIKTKGMFSHELHEAVEIEKTKKLKPGTIIKELAPGYKLSGKVIRPAKVRVARQ